MDSKRMIGVGILVSVIIALSVTIAINKDSWFQHRVEMNYPDNCMEEYIDGELVTPICVKGRELYKKQLAGESCEGENIWATMPPINLTIE